MKRKFTELEVNNLVWENEVERTEGEDRRWSRTNTSIVDVDGKLYRLFWEEGLTENQDNGYSEQEAEEVFKHEWTEVVTKHEWINFRCEYECKTCGYKWIEDTLDAEGYCIECNSTDYCINEV